MNTSRLLMVEYLPVQSANNLMKGTKRILTARSLPLLLCLLVAQSVVWADVVGPEADAGQKPPAKAAQEQAAGAIGLKPGAIDPYIAHWTARLLERHHYSQRSFDSAISSKLLDRYIRDLDFQRMHFLQSDLDDLEGYRYRLNKLILGSGDTTPAYVIFALFLKRFEQHVQYVDELLANEKFTFDTDERVVLNRRDLPFPKDMDEAKQLWRDRLRAEYLQEKLGGKKHDEIVDTLKRRYHRTLKMFKDWDSDNVLEVFLTSLARVYDPHSDYMGKSQTQDFSISMNLSLFGIGATLTSDDGYCKIRELVPGGPADRSGKLRPGDRIVAVAQGNEPPVDIVDMPLPKAVQLIRGPKGTEVRLTIIPANATDTSIRREVRLIRDEIKLEDQAAKGRIIELPAPTGGRMRIGVIDLPSFYGRVDLTPGQEKPEPRSASADVAKLLNKFKEEGVSGVILDLRRNGGGALDEAIKVTGLFIKKGPVVQVRDADGFVAVDEDRDPTVVYDGPLVVLTSRFSASASEIVAGALQDYGRAIIVGEASTYGKGTVQSLTPLRAFLKLPGESATNDPGTLKMTIRKFYRPSGLTTQLIGVTPDIVLPSVNNVAEVGESSLDNALRADTIPGTEFERLNRVQPYLAELRKRTLDRIKTDKEFDYVQEDIETVKKLQADKSVSLNEKQRLKEKEEDEVRQKARQKERLARNAPDETVYEIPLKLATQPGLPPPSLKTNLLIAAQQTQATNKPVELPNAGPAGALLAATNATHDPVLSEAATKTEDATDPAEQDKSAAPDFVLAEAQHILVDYLSLLPKDVVVIVNRSNEPH